MRVFSVFLYVAVLAVLLNGQSPETLFQAMSEGDAIRADSLSSELYSTHPDDPFVAYLRSLTLYEIGDYPAAAREAGRAVASLPRVEPEVRSRMVAHAEYLDSAIKVLQGFRKIEGNHFIFCYGKPADSVLADELFDVLDSARAVVGRDLGYLPPDKVRVEAYPDRAAFITVSTLTADEVNRTGTIALCKFNRLLFVSPRALTRGYGWKETLCHEYVHFVINRVSKGRAPLWFHEGLAHFEEVRYSGRPGGELSLLEKDLLFRALRDNTLVSFDRMYPSMAKLKDATESGTAFAEVVLAVRWLHEKGGYPAIRALLRAPAPAAFDSLLNVTAGTPGGFEKGLFDYIRTLKLAPVEGITVLGREFKEDGAAEDEAFRFRKFVRLAEMLAEKRRMTAAIRELERADESGPVRSPWVLGQIARLHEKSGRPDEARTLLDRTIVLFPDYCNGYFNRALFRKGQGDRKGALSDLKAVLDINPFHIPARKARIELLESGGEGVLLRKEQRILEYLMHHGT